MDRFSKDQQNLCSNSIGCSRGRPPLFKLHLLGRRVVPLVSSHVRPVNHDLDRYTVRRVVIPRSNQKYQTPVSAPTALD